MNVLSQTFLPFFDIEIAPITPELDRLTLFLGHRTLHTHTRFADGVAECFHAVTRPYTESFRFTGN